MRAHLWEEQGSLGELQDIMNVSISKFNIFADLFTDFLLVVRTQEFLETQAVICRYLKWISFKA
jgi:hypothetical protein